MAAQAQSISAQDAHAKLEMDPGAMLVCAYEKGEKFEKHRLEGAIPFDQFRSQEGKIPKNREIIFYCA